jgi:hypothetical protein
VFYAPFVGLVVFDAAILAQWCWNGSAWSLAAPRLLEASTTDNPASVGAGITTTVTVTGATLGDLR